MADREDFNFQWQIGKSRFFGWRIKEFSLERNIGDKIEGLVTLALSVVQLKLPKYLRLETMGTLHKFRRNELNYT